MEEERSQGIQCPLLLSARRGSTAAGRAASATAPVGQLERLVTTPSSCAFKLRPSPDSQFSQPSETEVSP